MCALVISARQSAFFFNGLLVRSCEQGRLGKECWHRLLAPVLGALAVARQPSSRDSLMTFAGLSIEETANVLREVGQFVLNRPGPDGVCVYGIFHSSFSEYLLDPAANQEWSLDGARAHSRIADWALQHSSTLEASLPKLPISGGRSSSESYALDHLPFHLSAAAATSELQALLTEFVWCAARLTSSGSAGLLADFQFVRYPGFWTSDGLHIPFAFRITRSPSRGLGRATAWSIAKTGK